MKPEPVSLTSLASRTGSPAKNGERAIDPASCVRPVVAANEIRADGRCRPVLPFEIVGIDGLTERNLRLGDKNIGGLHVDHGCRRRLVGFAREVSSYSAGADSIDQDHDTRGIHTLHFPRDAATKPSAQSELTS